jgi:type I restriction enzyme S subunit
MKHQALLEHFNDFIESPNGVDRLREIILELAVSGNLSQESNEILNSETSLPSSWSLKPFSEIARYTIGKTPPTKDSSYWSNDKHIMWVSIADIQNGKTISESNKYVSELAQAKIFRKEPWPVGTLLMSFKLTIGKMARLGCPAYFNEAIFAFDSGNEITNEYLFRVLPLLSQRANSKGAIKGNTLNSDSISEMLIPLPPLVEQSRIVEVIDELIEKCEVLKANINYRESIGSAARKSFVDAISSAQGPEEFQRAWERIQNNWQLISGTPEGIEDLRGLILTLATNGFLVKQNLSEEPLRFDSVTHKGKMPRNWIWCRLDSIAAYGGNGTIKPNSIPKDSWILDLEDIEKNTSKLLRRSLGATRLTTSNKSPFKAGDVLYGKLRPYLDKVLVADLPGFCTTEIVPIRPKVGVNPHWLRICLKRPEFIKIVNELSYGTKMPRLGTDDAKASIHPLPPLEEQERIVAKVNQLFEICDQLDNTLREKKRLAEMFAQSVVSVSI